MSRAWGVFGFVGSLGCHRSSPFICFVIHIELELRSMLESGVAVRVGLQ